MAPYKISLLDNYNNKLSTTKSHLKFGISRELTI